MRSVATQLGPRVHETRTTTLNAHEIGTRTDTCQGDTIRLLSVSRIDPRKGLRVLPGDEAHGEPVLVYRVTLFLTNCGSTGTVEMQLRAPVRVTPAVLDPLRELRGLAPEHLPQQLLGVAAVSRRSARDQTLVSTSRVTCATFRLCSRTTCPTPACP